MPGMTLVFSKDISAAKEEILRRTHDYLYPGRVERLLESGIDFVPGRREGYRYWDVDGRELLDVHLNGGTFNLGHRNPELIRILTDGLAEWDVGNHHFGSGPKAELSQALVGRHCVMWHRGRRRRQHPEYGRASHCRPD